MSVAYLEGKVSKGLGRIVARYVGSLENIVREMVLPIVLFVNHVSVGGRYTRGGKERASTKNSLLWLRHRLRAAARRRQCNAPASADVMHRTRVYASIKNLSRRDVVDASQNVVGRATK